MKKMPAFIAAFIMTFCVGAVMLVMGVNALLNPTSAQASDSPEQPQVQNVSEPAGSDAQAQAQIQQLQARIKEYQAREKQYQEQLTQAQQQMNQANNEAQQYQSIIQQLVNIGIIRVDQNGQLMLPRGFRGFDDDHD